MRPPRATNSSQNLKHKPPAVPLPLENRARWLRRPEQTFDTWDAFVDTQDSFPPSPSAGVSVRKVPSNSTPDPSNPPIADGPTQTQSKHSLVDLEICSSTRLDHRLLMRRYPGPSLAVGEVLPALDAVVHGAVAENVSEGEKKGAVA